MRSKLAHWQGMDSKYAEVSLARRLLVAALAAVIWLLAPSARAAAPRCDIRAATTLAPAPTLEEPTASIDIGDDSCAPPSPLDALQEGRTSNEIVFSNVPDVTLARASSISPALEVGTLPRAFDTGAAAAGVRSSIDRPPR